jgi:hypothetical protein
MDPRYRKWTPDDCHFCKTRIGLQSCLLPYAIIREFKPSEDILTNVLEMTELHTRFGIELLNTGFQTRLWMLTRPSDAAIASYADSISHNSMPTGFVPSTPQEPQSTDISIVHSMESQLPESPAPQPVQAPPEPTLPAKEQNPPLCDGVSLPNVGTPTMAKVAATPAPFIPKSPTMETAISEETHKEQAPTAPVQNLSEDELMHLLDDLCIAAIAAHKMENKGRARTHASELYNSINYEIELLKKFGDNYESSHLTSLDHQIPLAKEIVSMHNPTTLFNWEVGHSSKEARTCMLNFDHFTATKLVESTNGLTSSLISYVRSVLRGSHLSPHDSELLRNHMKDSLTRRSEQTTYHWISIRIRQLSTPAPKLKSTKPQEPTQAPTASEDTHECPPYDLKYNDLINVHLTTTVTNVLENKCKTQAAKLRMKDCSQYFCYLTSEFIKHRKSWHNPNSFTTIKQLQLLLDEVAISAPARELTTQQIILSVIIDDMRQHAKEMFTTTSR